MYTQTSSHPSNVHLEHYQQTKRPVQVHGSQHLQEPEYMQTNVQAIHFKSKPSIKNINILTLHY